MSLVLLHAREEQLQREVEIRRVVLERQAEQPQAEWRRSHRIHRALGVLSARMRRAVGRTAPAPR
jgi:hypothetical protein